MSHLWLAVHTLSLKKYTSYLQVARRKELTESNFVDLLRTFIHCTTYYYTWLPCFTCWLVLYLRSPEHNVEWCQQMPLVGIVMKVIKEYTKSTAPFLGEPFSVGP